MCVHKTKTVNAIIVEAFPIAITSTALPANLRGIHVELDMEVCCCLFTL